MPADLFPFPDSQLCALVSKGNGEDPVGSATPFDHCLAFELPPPWAKNALQSSHLPQDVQGVLEQVSRQVNRCKVQVLAPDPAYSVSGHVRVLHFGRPVGPFAVYDKAEYLVPARKLAALITALLLTPGALPTFEGYRQDTAHLRDLLVCVHGNRDVCCGRFGEETYQHLRLQHAGPRLRVWRTSHIGGHKFAPTLLDFPEGRYWGHLELEALPALVNRDSPVAALSRFYRGWSGLGRFEQVAERAVFEREGWAWVAYPKTGEIVERDDSEDRVTVRITFSHPDGTPGAYEATVACAGTVTTLASSGSDNYANIKQYRVQRLERLG